MGEFVSEFVSDAGTIYADARRRVNELATGLSADELATKVPGTPSWTVKDVVSHLCGVVSDIQSGRTEGAPGEEWTARHVAERNVRDIKEILDEWNEKAPAFEERLSSIPALAATALDVLSHEADIRGALGRPRPSSTGLEYLLQTITAGIDRRLKSQGGPGLRITSGSDEWILGPGEPAATLSVDPYELMRAGVGRRSEAQIREYAWDGDPSPYVPVFAIFSMPETDLREP